MEVPVEVPVEVADRWGFVRRHQQLLQQRVRSNWMHGHGHNSSGSSSGGSSGSSGSSSSSSSSSGSSSGGSRGEVNSGASASAIVLGQGDGSFCPASQAEFLARLGLSRLPAYNESAYSTDVVACDGPPFELPPPYANVGPAHRCAHRLIPALASRSALTLTHPKP